ncbi:hypothetical protein [Streptomyces sp. CA-253872]|uniref:hypothetical protein n=1 Tax=Streptomyces sp. CA-253872 TaxID=3240067 RepID=UPI003D90B3D6
MSSEAALRSAPDPDDVATNEPQETPGEGAAPLRPVSLVKAPQGPSTADTHEDQDAEADESRPEEDADDAPAPRALIVPNLRPYLAIDAATARELGALATDLTRSTAPRIRRDTLFICRSIQRAGRRIFPGMWRDVRTGTRVLGALGRAWFAAELAPKVKPLVRLLVAPGVAVYAVVRVADRVPVVEAVVPALALCALVPLLAERWAVLHVARARKRKEKKPAPLTARLAAVLDTPTDPSGDQAAEAAEDVPPAPADNPAQPPSRDDITRALHALVGTSSGVLTTALRDYLGYPSTKAVREALKEAGFPPPRGVRAMGANGPGIHRRDFPPLPSPREGHPDPALSQVNAANNNTNNTGEGSEEGLDAVGNDRGERPFDVVPDPERGPTAWKVVPRS